MTVILGDSGEGEEAIQPVISNDENKKIPQINRKQFLICNYPFVITGRPELTGGNLQNFEDYPQKMEEP